MHLERLTSKHYLLLNGIYFGAILWSKKYNNNKLLISKFYGGYKNDTDRCQNKIVYLKFLTQGMILRETNFVK